MGQAKGERKRDPFLLLSTLALALGPTLELCKNPRIIGHFTDVEAEVQIDEVI
jgi:hypothetical protein